MGKLIDNDELIKALDDYCGTQKYLISENVRKIIEEQPTAYDVDKVVEQLEELYDVGRSWTHKSISLNGAIEIVKVGGKE